MASIKDVAARAGVSISTVSHVLNNTRYVSEVLRQRVLDAQREVGHETNAVARSLKLARSHTLGLIISDISNPFFTAVVRGIEDIALAKGYTVVLCNSDEDPEKEATYLRTLRARRVDGLILVPAGEAHPYLRRLLDEGFPVVFLDRETPGLTAPTVLLDNEAAAHEAVAHLVALGHRRIGMIAGKPHITTTTARVDGYRRALEEAGLPFDPELVVAGASRFEGGRQATLSLLGRTPRPTAIFAGNNLMTVGALAAIDEHELAVPADVALVGFDDFEWSGVFRPRLTTIAQPTYELGRTAGETLINRLEGHAPVGRIVLRGRLVVRESSVGTAPAAAAAPHPLATAGGTPAGLVAGVETAGGTPAVPKASAALPRQGRE